MGKVLSTFEMGYAGAVSRSIDNIIVALPNCDSSAIVFGAPVFLSSDKKGAVNASASSTAAVFLGFAVRSASKTPDTYGSSLAEYAPGELTDVITRGSVIVATDGSCGMGDQVYLNPSTMHLTPQASSGGNANIALPGVRYRSPRDSSGMAEILLTTRNIQ